MRIYKDGKGGRKITIEEDLHDEIMIEVIKYFEASELWEEKKGDKKAIEARNALGRLRVLARKRRMEIQSKQKEVIKTRRDKMKGESNE
jgi:hypothetical protein